MWYPGEIVNAQDYTKNCPESNLNYQKGLTYLHKNVMYLHVTHILFRISRSLIFHFKIKIWVHVSQIISSLIQNLLQLLTL